MREIKFRAYVTNGTKVSIHEDVGILNGLALNKKGEVINKAHVVQYTGLKDKNGVEIYEGDIGEMQMINEFGSAEIKRGVMEMHTDGFYSFRTESNYDLDKTSPPIVVGNIYQNPDLLK